MNFQFKGTQFILIILILALSIYVPPIHAKPGRTAGQSDHIPKSVSSIDTVLRVIDGDTFILTGDRHIRLLCLDTPEKGEPYADKAKAFGDSLLRGKAVKLETEKNSVDKYGRTLAYIYLGSDLYNEMLLKAGLARIYFFAKNQRHAKELLAAQNEARTAKRGIWSLPAPAPEPYYIVAGGSFRFHRPLCPGIKEINQKKAKRYKSRDDALNAGLSPCRECKP
jgi:micrococcal nuclease